MCPLIPQILSHLPSTLLKLALDLGAGEGETALWLAKRGFTVDAVERDPDIFARLVEACAGTSISTHLVDVTEFPLPPATYDLIVAQAVLHFLRPTQLWPLADRLAEALVPGGLLVAEVFTTDDPGCVALKESGATEIEPNTFLAPEPIGLIHYFAPDELHRIFAPLEILEYEESRQSNPRSEDGYRAGAQLVAKRPRPAKIGA